MQRLSRPPNFHYNNVVPLSWAIRIPVIPFKTYSTSVSIPSSSRTQAISPIEVARKKQAARGGQNLSLRYSRLEKSLRGKGGYDQKLSELNQAGTIVLTSSPTAGGGATQQQTFMGLVLPEKPNPPADDECCMSGCAICVYDLYQESTDEYTQKLESLRTSLNLLHIPESKWPASIRPGQGSVDSSPKKIVLSAFEELELRLKQKQQESHNSERPLGGGTSNPPLPEALDTTVSISTGDTAGESRDDASDSEEEVALLAEEAASPVPGEGGQPQVVRKRRRKKNAIPDAASVYEGLRWVLFSNR